MSTYFIHPKTEEGDGLRPGIIIVSQKRSVKGREVYRYRFTIDTPGAWFDDVYNLHIDGTDNPFKTLEECLKAGVRFYEGENADCEFLTTSFPAELVVR